MRRPRQHPTAASAVTMHDIAREADVSTATVSRALRGLPRVSPGTRDRVISIAEKMDYFISPTASRLASGRAGSIAVVTPFIARWYFSTVLSGVEQVLRTSDLDLILLSVGEPDEEGCSPPIRKLRGRVDGVLVISLSPEDVHVRAVRNLKVPISVIGSGFDGAASVTIDDVMGAQQATQHLVNLGHERIGLIGGRNRGAPFQVEHARRVGFLETLEAAGLSVDPELEAPGHFTIEGGEQAMSDLLSRPNPPTAVVAMSDEMAFGALRSLRVHGMRPGSDISLVGFDDHDMSDILDLTTVAQPVREIGELAAVSLLDLLAGQPVPPSRQLPTRLAVRGSTAPRRPE